MRASGSVRALAKTRAGDSAGTDKVAANSRLEGNRDAACRGGCGVNIARQTNGELAANPSPLSSIRQADGVAAQA